MTIGNTLDADVQSSAVGNIVELFELDATNLGAGTVVRFIKATKDGDVVEWNGNAYNPIDFESEGWDKSADGKLPRPTIRISNVSKTLAGSVITYDDLLGATLYRYRTLEKYLDGEAEADPNIYFPVDVFTIERKTQHNKVYIEWELSAYMDFEGTMLPKRQVLRDTCTHYYRDWDTTTSGFDYTNATCPYTDSNYWDIAGDVVVSGTDDDCGKKLSDCKLRFPDADLPTRAFPGAGKVRVR